MTDPNDPTRPSQRPDEPTRPVEPTPPAGPTSPYEQTRPMETPPPYQPAAPVQPTDRPATPVEPTRPVEPVTRPVPVTPPPSATTHQAVRRVRHPFVGLIGGLLLGLGIALLMITYSFVPLGVATPYVVLVVFVVLGLLWGLFAPTRGRRPVPAATVHEQEITRP